MDTHPIPPLYDTLGYAGPSAHTPTSSLQATTPEPWWHRLPVLGLVIAAIGLVLAAVPLIFLESHPVSYLRAAGQGAGSTTTLSTGLATVPEHTERNQAPPDLASDPQIRQDVPESGGRPSTGGIP